MLISYKNANIYQRHGICVLKNVNFQVDEGQFIYLIGRVGSGKTTLMRTLYCELELDEADEANVLGYDLLTIRNKDIPALRREWVSYSRISSCWQTVQSIKTLSLF